MTTRNTESRATGKEQAHQKVIACEKCNYEWETRSEMERVTCPNCQRKTEQNLVKLRWIERAKWTYDGATSIEEMAKCHEQRASHLRAFRDRGWVLKDDAVRDDDAYLTYDLTEGGQDGN